MSDTVAVDWSDGELVLRGPLTYDTVPALERRMRSEFRQHGLPRRIDLAGSRPADSAGFALVLEWLAMARQQGQDLEFANPPSQLVTLAGLSSALGLLGWADERSAPDAGDTRQRPGDGQPVP
jgi:phospholipid transport system transporter-binding protein